MMFGFHKLLDNECFSYFHLFLAIQSHAPF